MSLLFLLTIFSFYAYVVWAVLSRKPPFPCARSDPREFRHQVDTFMNYMTGEKHDER